MGIKEHLSQAVLGTATSLERSYVQSCTNCSVHIAAFNFDHNLVSFKWQVQDLNTLFGLRSLDFILSFDY